MRRTVGCLAIFAYSSGCVYVGSSPSLCPWRRYPTRSITTSSWYLRAVRHRESHGGEARLGLVRVHVHDREVEALGEVARVARRAAFLRRRREADLVVHDDVDRAADRVAVRAARG